jgi:tRNA1(Val) A37 N6-methylase TrmN6
VIRKLAARANSKEPATTIADVDVSRDRFHHGAFEAYQPVRRGHRSGSDALLLAAALPRNATGVLADLGAGAGVAGFAALAMNPTLRAVLIEVDPVMAAIAARSLSLAGNRSIGGRASTVVADATLSGRMREEAGLANESFDFVIMNPPYHPAGQRASSDPARARAHVMGEGGLEPWMRTAAAILRHDGMLHMIYRAENLGEVIASAQGRFGGLAILPLHAYRDAPAGRVIVRAARGSRAPLSIWPGVVLHEADGASTALADEALNGRARLFT